MEFSHSVIGIISIPGMMTGAILGGSSVHQAAKLQMIIMFMITANIVLASVFITFIAIIMVIDHEHRIRSDRIDNKKPVIYRVKDWNVGELSAGLSKSFNSGWRILQPRTGGGVSAGLSGSFNSGWRILKSRTGGGESDMDLERLLM